MENKNKHDLVDTISGSLPIWSFFLGSMLSSVLGVLFLILPNILQKFEINIDPVKQLALSSAGLVWIFGCGGYLLLIAPIKEVYGIRSMLKNYVSRSDCNGCADIHDQLMQECLFLKTENAKLSGQISELKSIKNVGCQD